MNWRIFRKPALIGTFIAWLFFVISNYYIVHKPFAMGMCWLS